MRYVECQKKGGIVLITIKRPTRNKFNNTLIKELRTIFEGLLNDDDLSGVIITGKGPCFSHGAELKEWAALNQDTAKDFSLNGQETFLLLNRLDVPVIAAINGNAYGPGLELTLACDARIATGNCEFQHPETKLGIVPCFGGTVRLTKLIGRQAADDLINDARRIGVDEAHKLGLIDYIVDKDILLFEAERIITSEEVPKQKFRWDDFQEERDAFARCYGRPGVKKRLRSKS